MAKLSKLYPAHVASGPKKILPIVGLGLVLTGFLQSRIDPIRKEMQSGQDEFISASGSLNNEFLLLPLLGFREAAAGLLWVRCDEFFHSGDYDAILPLVRLITWLDPHADNVYITGAWHLAYNFTDSNERSDRRYISPSQRLLREGVRNNMHIPDIKFELGWQNYDKVKDYEAAKNAFEDTIKTRPSRGSDEFPYGSPLKAHHILAHTYARMGRIPEAIAVWTAAAIRCDDQLKTDPNNYSLKSLREAERRNLEMLYQRWRDRYQPGPQGHSDVNPTAYPAVLAPPPKSSDKTPRPWDVNFNPKLELTRPKVLKVTGIMNIADGARVDIRITDWDYKERDLNTKLERFDVDANQSILMDTASVRKNKYEREIDMSKDPKMYSFASDFYRATFSFNIRITSPHVQDRHGWSGEGLTDKNSGVVYLDKRPELMGTTLIAGQGGEGTVWDGKTIPTFGDPGVPETYPWGQGFQGAYGQPNRMIKVTYKLSKSQILGQKPITNADIVPNDVQ